ncbi:MAG: CaiB/BaiF CoA-transferase family protein [Raoultibacter sp.]
MALKLLEGMKVIEIAFFMAAPIAGRVLGEWGADVIKVEPPSGDSNRGLGLARHIHNGDQAGWDAINSSKRCITIDTRTPEGLVMLKDMLRDCDVFLSHLRPKDSKKLGLDYESLSKENPKIICGTTSGYGLKGEWSERGGYDAASYSARVGFGLDCPVAGDNPMIPYFGFGDLPTGTYLAMAVMAAYIAQQRTGKGQDVNVALMHAGMWSAGVPVVTAAYGDEYPVSPNAVLPLARPYECADGKSVALMGLKWHESWPEFVKVFGLPEELIAQWPDYQTALACAAQITPIITEKISTLTRDEVLELLVTTNIPFDLCQHFVDLQEDRQAWDAGFFQGITYPSGKKIGIVKAPAVFSSGEAEFGASGYPGEYTRTVLKEYGYDDAAIDELRAKGVITEEDQWDKDQYNVEKLMAQTAAAKKK